MISVLTEVLSSTAAKFPSNYQIRSLGPTMCGKWKITVMDGLGIHGLTT